MPAASIRHQSQRIIGEITAAKQAADLTQMRAVDAAAINSALRERQDHLKDELIAQESARFSKGEISVLVHGFPEPSAIYSGGDPRVGWETWQNGF